jgi:hypothetical protein
MVTVVGYLRTNTMSQIPLKNTSVTNGTEFTLQTDSDVTTTAQNIGNYMPGATIISGEIACPAGASFFYILRQGVILAHGIPNSAGVTNREQPLSTPVVLRPGDTLRVLSLAAASRNAALLVKTNAGMSRIFVGTPAGAATTQLLDLQDSTSIGDTLQGQTLVQACFLSIDGNKISSSGGAWIRNSSGQIAGIVPASNPQSVEPMWSNVNIPISLNWTANVVTTS